VLFENADHRKGHSSCDYLRRGLDGGKREEQRAQRFIGFEVTKKLSGCGVKMDYTLIWWQKVNCVGNGDFAF